METVELRPVSLGELLDCTFETYRHHFISRPGSPIPFHRPLRSPQPVLPFGYFGFLFLFWLVESVALGAMTHAVSESFLGHSPRIAGAWRRARRELWRLVGLALNVEARVFGSFVGAVILAVIDEIAPAADTVFPA